VIFINNKREEEIKKMLCYCRDYCNSKDYFNELRLLGTKLKDQSELNIVPDFFSALASKERIIILKSLIERDRCVCELEVILNKSQSTISHHLRKLERANLITGWKNGNYTYYGIIGVNLKKYLKLIHKIFNIDNK